MGLGANYTKVFDEQNKISFGLDLNKLLVPASPPQPANGTDTVSDQAASTDYYSQSVVSSWFSSFNGQFNTINASVGAEYTYNDQFAFRLGYFYESKEQGGQAVFYHGCRLEIQYARVEFFLSDSFGIRYHEKSSYPIRSALDWYLIWRDRQSEQAVPINNLKI